MDLDQICWFFASLDCGMCLAHMRRSLEYHMRRRKPSIATGWPAGKTKQIKLASIS